MNQVGFWAVGVKQSDGLSELNAFELVMGKGYKHSCVECRSFTGETGSLFL